jgi:hypothetical protein
MIRYGGVICEGGGSAMAHAVSTQSGSAYAKDPSHIFDSGVYVVHRQVFEKWAMARSVATVALVFVDQLYDTTWFSSGG